MIKFLPLDFLGVSQRILWKNENAVYRLQIPALIPEILKFEKCVEYASEMTDDAIKHLLWTQILCPGHKKCFWFCSETFCVLNKCFPVCAAQETSWATMCPQQCVHVYQGLKVIELCMETPCWCPSETSAIEFCHWNEKLLLFSKLRTEDNLFML